MLQRHKVSPNITLRLFINKVITPVVLLLGLLILIVFNFNGVLKTAQTQDDEFHNQVVYSQQTLSSTFKPLQGANRPVVYNSGNELLSYNEWSSTISVDGNVQELWNNDHGYSFDATKRQVFNTITGTGWQLIEVATLQDSATEVVSLNFVARPLSANKVPNHYVVDIAHVHSFWYNPQVQGSSFTAQVVEGDPTQLQNITSQSQASTTPIGSISLNVTSASGGSVAAPQIILSRYGSTQSQAGNSPWSQAFTTEYSINDPAANQMIPLGTETLTFHPVAKDAGAPVGGPVPLPTPVPASSDSSSN